MPRQDPFEGIVEEALHRADLLLPGVPAGVAEGVETVARRGPGEVVAGEEEAVPVEEDGVAAGVARHRDRHQVVGEMKRLQAVEGEFDSGGVMRDVVAVEDSLAAEFFVEEGVVGDVVAVGQEHRGDAAHRGEALHQRGGGAGGIDQDVSFGAADEVAPGGEGVFRGEAAEGDLLFDWLGEGADARLDVDLRDGADRVGGAGDERHEGAPPVGVALRLMFDIRMVCAFGEDGGGDLPAGGAVDAAAVDVKVPFDIFGETLGRFGHDSTIASRRPAVNRRP